MPNPICERCKKTVYPMEKLSYLDKVWHKGCFKCEVCGMTLNLKSYKGYNKLPYCQVHVPTTKHTVVADTVENRRLKANTQQQSQILYHKDHEASKGRYTVISDDPETQRAVQVSRNASNLAYQSGQQRGDSYDPRMPSYVGRPDGSSAAASGPSQTSQSMGKRFKALFDYTKSDADEITLQEGDIITDPLEIDSGWMEGRNQRTGKFGMFPANYVERH